MKNITFSAEDQLIEQARRRAQRKGTTLNEDFQRWLAAYALQEERLSRFDDVARQLRGKARVGRKLGHDEMNAR